MLIFHIQAQDPNKKIALFWDILYFHSSKLCSLLDSHALFLSFDKTSAVIWCARIVLVKCETLRKESAVPAVATPASHKADVHPELSKKAPIVSQIHISMWSPPNIITNLSSPNVFGLVH